MDEHKNIEKEKNKLKMQKYRKRLKERGLIQLRVLTYKEYKNPIREYAKKLNNRKEKQC
jgi:hypothetical protein